MRLISRIVLPAVGLALPLAFAAPSRTGPAGRQLQRSAMSSEILTSKKSPHSFDETVDRLERAVRGAGATVFAKIDHAAAASSVGSSLRPTTVLIFGNPKAGTPLMQHAQTLGLDLPLRVLVWRDEAGQVWLTYRDAAALAHEHGIEVGDARLAPLAGALQRFTDEATRP